MIKWKNINWLFVASSFTAAYLIFIVVWIGPHEIIAFSETDQLNAIGDFLAGIFSPLAFIWLVAAVLTQRQELTDTRDQFAENQKVVDAQLKTINEQSELLQQQHTLAEETARKTYRLNLFEQRFAIYNELVGLHGKMEVRITADTLIGLRDISSKASFVFHDSVTQYLNGVASDIVAVFNFEEENADAWYTPSPWNPVYEGGEKEILRNKATRERLRITGLLSKDALREVTWNDLHVSDN